MIGWIFGILALWVAFMLVVITGTALVRAIRNSRPAEPWYEREVVEYVPNVEDSPAWPSFSLRAAQPEQDPAELLSFDDALVKVLSVGASLRACNACGSPATDSSRCRWRWEDDDIQVRVREKCLDCQHECEYDVSASLFVAIEAMHVWEQGRTALAAAKQMIANEQEQQDLDELDAG